MPEASLLNKFIVVKNIDDIIIKHIAFNLLFKFIKYVLLIKQFFYFQINIRDIKCKYPSGFLLLTLKCTEFIN